MAGIRLVLADVDGTLVTKEKVLTPRAIAAVQALREAGIAFAITSGRPPRGMRMLIEPLGIETPIAGFNGGMWVNPDLSLIEAHTLPKDVAERALSLIEEDGVDAWLYSGDDWLIHKADAPHAKREEWTVKFPPKIVADFGAAIGNAVKIVGVSDDPVKLEACEKRVQEALGKSVSAARSQSYYLDVTHPDANKGSALLYLGKRLGIAPKQIATLGDQPNDMLMFRVSGLSIAMGSSSEEVKKQADHVTASSDEEGFAIAVERFILGSDHD